MHSYFLAGITWGKLIRLLKENGFSARPRILLRVLFLMQNGMWASLSKYRENKLYGRALQNHNTPDDPVFITGHWRTGSTFLHKLLSLDDNFTVPTVFQVSVPDSFLVSRKYYEPVMTRVLSDTRPMDNVKLGFDEPQEDEYALMKLSLDSPLIRLIFPRSNDYFLKDFEDFDPTDLGEWKESLSLFLRKLDYATGKRVVLKNPFHSMRIPLLAGMFPNARFIHIYRNPYDVIPSTVNLWKVTGEQNVLKKRSYTPGMDDVIDVFDRVTSKLKDDLNGLPGYKRYEIRFEDLEKDALKELNGLYEHFGWKMTDEMKKKLGVFLDDSKDYKKNTFHLTEEQRRSIREKLAHYFAGYGYD